MGWSTEGILWRTTDLDLEGCAVGRRLGMGDAGRRLTAGRLFVVLLPPVVLVKRGWLKLLIKLLLLLLLLVFLLLLLLLLLLLGRLLLLLLGRLFRPMFGADGGTVGWLWFLLGKRGE